MQYKSYDQITGSGSLVKTGAEHAYLNHANSYTGATTVSQGRLYLEVAGALPSTTNVTIASGAHLYCDYDQTCVSLAGAGTVHFDTTSLTLTDLNDTSFSGTLHSSNLYEWGGAQERNRHHDHDRIQQDLGLDGDR